MFHVTANANSFHIHFHDNAQGVTGTGLTTGDSYRAEGSTAFRFNVAAGETQTFINNFLVIGQGPDNNFTVHEKGHLTINANGEVTVSRDEVTVECR